jgi:hypothetical protein
MKYLKFWLVTEEVPLYIMLLTRFKKRGSNVSQLYIAPLLFTSTNVNPIWQLTVITGLTKLALRY